MPLYQGAAKVTLTPCMNLEDVKRYGGGGSPDG